VSPSGTGAGDRPSRLRTAPGLAGGRFAIISAAAALVLVAAVPASAQFSVYPATVQLGAAQGVGAATITVENEGDTPLEARVYLADYDRDDDGRHRYSGYGEGESSCAGRLETFPDRVAVAPGERGEVRLRVQPASSTCWAVIFVERRTPTSSGITVAQRIGVKVLVAGEGGSRAGEVVGMAGDPDGPTAVVAFENTGTAFLEVEGEVEVRDLDGEIVAVAPVELFRVLPGHRRRVRVPLEGLDPGEYVLVSILDFGGEYLAGGQALLQVDP
jgi:hypothetical protein